MKSKALILAVILVMVLPYFVPGEATPTPNNIVLHNNNEAIFLEISNGKSNDTGCNDHGQLGTGTTDKVLTPVQIGKDLGKVTNVICDNDTTLFTIDGKLYGSGKNNCGQLGTGTTDNVLTPVQIGKDLGKVTNVICDNDTTLFTIDGKLYGSGKNNCGQLGTGTNMAETQYLEKQKESEKLIAVPEHQKSDLQNEIKKLKIEKPIRTNLHLNIDKSSIALKTTPCDVQELNYNWKIIKNGKPIYDGACVRDEVPLSDGNYEISCTITEVPGEIDTSPGFKIDSSGDISKGEFNADIIPICICILLAISLLARILK
ncbi:MAG: hypothetical protein MJY54_02930 [archaeon]|nr:hypothetical protein [archaeon]